MRELIADQLAVGRTAADPWPALERAHIASQPWTWPHARVHVAMFRTAWRQRDRHELVAQLVRLALAAPGSFTGRYPRSNTGRFTMGLTETAPIPHDLSEQLRRASAEFPWA